MENKKIYKYILPIICACSALLLSVVNMVTAPKIRAYEEQLTISALEEVSMGFKVGEVVLVNDNSFVSKYYPLASNNVIEGYILELNSSGYGGPISLVASYNSNGQILKIKMVSNSETPGIGKKSENAGYMDMFVGTGYIVPVPLKKDQLSSDHISVVSGATLTFTGISKALSAGSDFVKSIR